MGKQKLNSEKSQEEILEEMKILLQKILKIDQEHKAARTEDEREAARLEFIKLKKELRLLNLEIRKPLEN